uniref:RSE1/DDB1/CPSF1 first beta-propeller domain-containing protein n=1 Tax=Accipiter nisus TaxID=211598 RepID=A0A8B9RZF6_9AVES
MYAVYKQAHPPTGLEFSMFCNFFSNAERNLVVAGTSQLYVYRLNHDCKGHKEKLELVASFSFFGNVMSMASVQLAGAKRDALLLSFKDAKLSVVEYDPGTHDLKTLSLHYFEEPELRVGADTGRFGGSLLSGGAGGGEGSPPKPFCLLPPISSRRTASCRTSTSPGCGWTPTGAAPSC